MHDGGQVCQLLCPSAANVDEDLLYEVAMSKRNRLEWRYLEGWGSCSGPTQGVNEAGVGSSAHPLPPRQLPGARMQTVGPLLGILGIDLELGGSSRGFN